MEHETDEVEEQEPWHKGPVKWILAVFLALILVLMIVPWYSVKLDPNPKDIPKIYEFVGILRETNVGNQTSNLIEAVNNLDTSDPIIKQIATKIASQSCEQSRVCQAKALYYFVRDNVEYVSDPVAKEYIESPVEILQTRGGDCESGTLLLAALEESIGIDSEIVLIPGHAYLRIKLPDAINKYKIDGDWVYVDWTCNNCDFGEIPYQNINKKASYLEI
ncbi:transglutaminase-like domain-containing protein [Candidatus Woesearchaeota archaeon]|nr:transglutaminase-like domain-containing protein [Candidatus Woesearchaeota archaeon]